MDRHSKRAAPIIQGLPKTNYSDNYEKDGYMLVSINKSKRQNISERNMMVTLRSFINNILTRMGVISDAKYMSWTGAWTSRTSQQYLTNEVTRDGKWTMIANKDTTDRASPQNNGAAVNILPVDPTWINSANVSTVSLVHTYKFAKGGWFQALRLWPDNVGVNIDNHLYVVIQVGDLTQVTEVSLPELVSGQWNVVALERRIVIPGAIVSFVYDTLNSASNTVLVGDWTQLSRGNNVEPATGEYVLNQGRTRIRIHKVDNDSVNRGVELLTSIPDTVWKIVEDNDPTRSQDFFQTTGPVDAGLYVEFNCIEVDQGINGRVNNDVLANFTIIIPIPLSTKYVEEVNYWDNPANIPEFLTSVTSIKEFNGVPQAIGNNVYGIDFNFQQALVSPDWDLVAISAS